MLEHISEIKKSSSWRNWGNCIWA